MEQVIMKETAIWIEAIKTFGYIVAAIVPAYLSYRIVSKRMKRGKNVDTSE